MKPYAKVEIDLLDHPKALASGPAAMGVWTAMLLYIRRHLTDGFVPTEAVPVLFGGGAANAQSVRKLVAAGLIEPAQGGYQLCRYAEKNSTKAQVESSIESTRERVKKLRAKRACNALHDRNSGVAPVSVSVSVSGSDPEGESEREAGLVQVVPGNAVNDESQPEPTREDAYREAYERGVAKGKGGPYAMPREQSGHLHQAIKAFAKGGRTGRVFRGDELLEWIAVLAEEFAEHVVRHKDERAVGWYSGYGPKGFLKYLNEQATRRAEREVG